jgi:hypothetical protein
MREGRGLDERQAINAALRIAQAGLEPEMASISARLAAVTRVAAAARPQHIGSTWVAWIAAEDMLDPQISIAALGAAGAGFDTPCWRTAFVACPTSPTTCHRARMTTRTLGQAPVAAPEHPD